MPNFFNQEDWEDCKKNSAADKEELIKTMNFNMLGTVVVDFYNYGSMQSR